MYRPISLKQENTLSFELYRNRREAIGEIDPKYVTNIEYELHNFTEMTIEIPNKIHRNGMDMDFYLYDLIKGKMFIVMDFNGEKSKFIIDEEIDVEETKNGKKKTLKAYSYEKTLEKKTLLIGSGATRQLYRPKDEVVEVSDGILNWFEQQTGWTVGHVDELARKESMMYYTKQSITLFNTIEKQGLKFGDVLWEKDVNVSVQDRAINMVISYPDMETYDNEGYLWKRESISHTFTNLPYNITRISAKYSTTDTHKYALTYTITYVDGSTQEHSFAFANISNLKWIGKDIALTYETNDLQEHLTTKYRFFEQCSSKWYQFLTKDVATAYNCVFLFDSYNLTVNVYDKETFGTNNGLYMDWEFISSINKTHRIGDVISRLYIESPNTSIAEENPLGTEYIECFDYYINSGIMSQELTIALQKYKELIDQKQIEFLTVKLEKTKNDQKHTKADAELLAMQEKWKGETAILTAYITDGNQPTLQSQQSDVVKKLEEDIQAKMNEIQGLKDVSNGYAQQMTQIGIDIQKENATLNGQKIFTSEDLLELEDYTIEGSITNDYYTIPISLYNYGVGEVEKLNTVAIDFTINAKNFVEKIVHPKGWSYYIKLGEKIEIDDMEIVDKDGFVQVYGFAFSPSENELSNLKFTNNKEQTTAVKTISDIGRQVNASTTMTSYWKDVWKDSATNNVHVSKLMEQGLDLAAQIARGRSQVNRIDISESGIYIIDSTNENNQIYLGSSLIAITTDRWKTSRTAIDAEGVIAETLIGKVILGEELIIGNEKETLKICKDGDTYGMFLYSTRNNATFLRMFLGLNKDGLPRLELFDEGSFDFQDENDEARKKALRVFLGVDADNKAKLKLFASNGDNGLVLSENGIYNCYQISDRDSFDYVNPFVSYFYVPSNLSNTFEAKIVVRLEKFRAYSKAAGSSTINLKTTESETINLKSTESETINLKSTNTQSFLAESTGGSGSIDVSISGVSSSAVGATVTGSGNVTATTGDAFSNGGRMTSIPYGENDPSDVHLHTHTHWVKLLHNHTIGVNCGSHSHTINLTGKASANTHTHNFTVPTHSHSITMPPHSHNVIMPPHSHTINMPSHTHNLTYGIFEHQTVPQCRIRLNNTDLNLVMNGEGEYSKDITNEFKGLKPGLNRIEIYTTQTNGLARANFTMFWGGFFNYY